MAKVIFTRNTESVQTDNGDFRALNTSGIYDCTIIRASFTEKAGTQATSIVLSVKTSEGEEATIYNGLSLTQNDGNEHFQSKVVNSLLTILDVEEVTTESETHTFGTKQVELEVIPELQDQEIKIKVVNNWYRKKDGTFGKSLEIKRFYSAKDGATATEIVNQVAELKQMKIDMEHASEDTYQKGVSKSDVIAPAAGNASTGTSAPTPNIFNQNK